MIVQTIRWCHCSVRIVSLSTEPRCQGKTPRISKVFSFSLTFSFSFLSHVVFKTNPSVSVFSRREKKKSCVGENGLVGTEAVPNINSSDLVPNISNWTVNYMGQKFPISFHGWDIESNILFFCFVSWMNSIFVNFLVSQSHCCYFDAKFSALWRSLMILFVCSSEIENQTCKAFLIDLLKSRLVLEQF